MRHLFLLPVVLGLAACAHASYCMKPQRYERANSIPPLHGTADLQIPRASNALVVPPRSGKGAPFGRQVADPDHPGRTMTQCLDQPPPLPQPKTADGG